MQDLGFRVWDLGFKDEGSARSRLLSRNSKLGLFVFDGFRRNGG